MLQGVATRRAPAARGVVDPALLLRLVRHPVFLAAMALNLVGFGLHVTALRALPLFLVQATIAGSVAVTAVLSVRVFAAPLNHLQSGAVGAVVAGLAMLAPTATTADAVSTGVAAPAVLLAALVAAAVASAGVGRLPGTAAATGLGLLAGVAFGVVALAVRLLPDLEPATLLRSPATYVLVLAGALAFHLYSHGMQLGSVTTTTAALVITQTTVPAVVGALLLGDRVRAGLAPVAVTGFVLALAGALGLARFETAAPPPDPTPQGAGRPAAHPAGPGTPQPGTTIEEHPREDESGATR